MPPTHTSSSGSITNSSNEETLRTPLLPTENFENTLPDGILTINAFEIAEGGYDEFVATILNRLVEICQANPWLLGRLEQTRTISLTSPLNGDFEIVTPVNLDRSALQARIQKDVFVESPSDLDWWNTLDGSPLADLMNFVAAKGPTANSTTGLHPNLPGRTYHDLSKLLKSHPDTGIPTGPESAKAQSSLFRVVILPTPTRRHAFLIMGMSHTVADGNTYHRILHMLLGSTNRKTRQPVEIVPLAYDMRASSLELQQEVDLQTLVKNYKRERDAVVPEAKLMDQIKLGLDIGRSAMKEQFYEGRQLQSFVTLVNLQEINRLKEEYAAPQFQDAVFAKDSERPPKSQTLSTNDILVCELSKLLNIDRVDTNMDVRIPVLAERMGFPKEATVDAAGNFVAMLPFFRPHFDNPWYVRKAMTRGGNTYYADPVERPKDYNITGNLSNWSGFTVGTQLGGTTCNNANAKLVLHLPINVTASGKTPFEQALVFCPFQDQPKQLAVIFSTHRYQKLMAQIAQQPADRQLLMPFVKL